jgi:hypothetical protein
LGSLIGGCLCLLGFIWVESRAHSPMLPLSLFRSRTFSGTNLLTLLLYSGIGVFFFVFPMNLIQVQGYTAIKAGAAVLPLIVLMFLLSRWSGGLVARYGPRKPLVLGPMIAASGFALFARPSVGGSYWTEFFPALVVLGFGMAVTVAPLTTVVMNSVGQDRIGTASGVNNALARVAGVLSIAVFGIVMVHGFASVLHERLASVPLPPSALHSLQVNETKLAGLPVPNDLDPMTKARVENAIKAAFVFGFRLVVLISALLSLASSAVAWILIPTVDRNPAPAPQP